MISAAAAFLERDFRVAWSYRMSFLFQYVSMPFALVTTRFVAELVAPQDALEQYGGDYFAFALLGVALQALMYPVLTVFRGAVREAQVMGTFEAILMTRTGAGTAVLASGLYQSAQAAVQPLLVIPLLGYLMGAPLAWSSSPLAFGVIVLALFGFAGFGLCSAAFTIAFKQSEPFTLGLFTVTTMLSGVVFPVALLPGWLQPVSQALPLTHAAEALRGVFIQGAHVAALGWHVAALSSFALMFPVGLFAIGRATESARDRGTLGQY